MVKVLEGLRLLGHCSGEGFRRIEVIAYKISEQVLHPQVIEKSSVKMAYKI